LIASAGEGGIGAAGGVAVISATLKMTSTAVDDNLAMGGSGGSVPGGTAGIAGQGLGGGLYVASAGTLQMVTDTVQFNAADAGSGQGQDNSGAALGGGLYEIGGSHVSIDAVTIIFNNTDSVNNMFNNIALVQ